MHTTTRQRRIVKRELRNVPRSLSWLAPLRRGWRLHVDMAPYGGGHAVDEVIRGAGDNRILSADPVRDLRGGTEVAADDDLAKLDRVFCGYHRDLRTGGLEQNAAGGNDERTCRRRQLEMHLSISARQQFAGWIGDIDFNQQCARGEIDSVIVARHLAIEGLVWKFRELYRDVHTTDDLLAIGFRKRAEEGHKGNPPDTEELSPGPAVTGVDEVADIGAAFGDNARKG